MAEINNILFWFILLLLYIQWHFFWGGHFLDKFRSNLFSIRGELFEYALEGKIGFDDYAYKELRRRINSILRYAHRFNFFNIIAFSVLPMKALEGKIERQQKSFQLAIDQITDKDKKAFIINIRERVRRESAFYLFRASPIFLFIVSFSIIFIFFKNLAKGILKFIKRLNSKQSPIHQEAIYRYLSTSVQGKWEEEVVWVNDRLGNQIEKENLIDSKENNLSPA